MNIIDEDIAVAYVRSGLLEGLSLFLPPSLYAEAVRALRERGATEDELSRVYETKPIPNYRRD